MKTSNISEILAAEQCSCVIANGNSIRKFSQRGVADLLSLLANEPDFLNGATVADKVVGKGAAALMVLGRVAKVDAFIISQPALDLFKNYNVSTTYRAVVPSILNNKGNGICPIEQLCIPCITAEECYFRIKQFFKASRE